MVSYFISDLHLQASREDITLALLRFLDETASDATDVYILGDFFDAWIGDDWNSALVKRVKHALTSCSDRGIRTHFIHGNRDFLIGQRFAAETQMPLLAEETVININGRKILLLHGDSLCTDDADYMAWRKKVRSAQWQKKVLRLPLFIRRLIAANYRRKSKNANTNKASNITDVTPLAVEDAFRRHGVELMIHGHTHRPKVHQIKVDGNDCERMVLGDWDDKLWYIRAAADRIELLNSTL